MNILKRPMFIAATVSSIAAAVSLYIKSLAIMILLAAVLGLMITVFFKKYKYITVAITIILFAVSLYFQFAQIKTINKYHNQNITGVFLVASEVESYDDFNLLTLKSVQNNTLPKGIKCLVFDEKMTKLKMGDIVEADVKLSIIDSYDEYRFSNYSNGIYLTANSIKISKTGDQNTFYNVSGKIRSYVKKTVSSKFDGDTAGFLLALTTGDKSLLSEDFLDNVKTTGISHVMVVSGMHLSIIMTAVFWCLDRLFYNKYIRALLSVVFVIFIFAVCGFTMSITRAGAMFIIAGMAPVFSRDNDSLNSLLVAVVMVLISAPFAIFNVSFQLSVLSTLAIIWVVPFYYNLVIERFKVSSDFLKMIINVSFCSIFAVIFTMPVTVKIFGFASIVSPLTNLLITYPVSLALILNIISIALYKLPIIKFISYGVLFIVKWCANIIVFIVNTIAKLPITVAVLPKSAFWWSIALIAIVIGYMHFYDYKRKRSDFCANSIRG